jgi:hypothetical protein
MPAEIVARILRLPGYGVYAWEADEAAYPRPAAPLVRR